MPKIINKTPHQINILGIDGRLIKVLHPVPPAIRSRYQKVECDPIDGIPITKTEFFDIENLPEQSEDFVYVVSPIVKNIVPGRSDLLVPVSLVRDQEGNILGCRSLGG